VSIEALNIDNRDLFVKSFTSRDIENSNLSMSVIVTNDITEVKTHWRTLEAFGLESPGQSFEFIRLWIKNNKIEKRDQSFFVVLLDGAPIIAIAFEVDRYLKVKVLVPFGGYHVGSGAPLVDYERMAKLSNNERRELWATLEDCFKGADIAFFRFVPKYDDLKIDIFEEIGISVPADYLYRAQFDSWGSCDELQRSRTRRKHDKQHSKKLNAMGDISFEEISAKLPEAKNIIDIMFEQRAKRFAIQGIDDPFTMEKRREFYRKAGSLEGDLSGVLHVLRLNGEIIAIRYNLVHQNRMFCLISSMIDDEKIQTAAPGKQCLLNVMQSVFDNDIAMYDMGAGLTDEKRHWCNKKIPLVHYYVPLTMLGHVVSFVHRYKKLARFKIKNNAKLIVFAKKIRSLIRKIK